MIRPAGFLAICGFAIAAAHAQGAPRTGEHATLQSKPVKETLAVMRRSSTWGHPDQYGEFNGMQRYAAGDYRGAMKDFLIGARFADKLSQLSIGLMYLNGEGVKKDPATAYAWVAIAAERNYPSFVATRQAIWAGLDATQRTRAKAMLDRLYPEYGDATAKPRMAHQLRWARMRLTGSMLGFGHSSVSSLTPEQFAQGLSPGGSEAALAGQMTGAAPACGAAAMYGSAITGCGDLYADWRWDPKQYFKARDAQWTGTVTIRPIERGTGKPDKPGAGH